MTYTNQVELPHSQVQGRDLDSLYHTKIIPTQSLDALKGRDMNAKSPKKSTA